MTMDAGEFTFVIVRGGDARLTPEVCVRTDVAYGLRDDYTAYMQQVYMVDFNWKRELTDDLWGRYLTMLRELKPYAAMIPDYEHPSQRRRLYRLIRDVRPLVRCVMVCPKFAGAVAHIPSWCRVAVSVPSEYAGFLPQPSELAGRECHLLGGHIDQWLFLKHHYSDARFVSGDTSSPVHQAHQFGKYWSQTKGGYVEMRGEFFDTEALAIASVRNMLSAWAAGEVIWTDRVARMIADAGINRLPANRLIA
jgi:hypothetical protein